jgi:hypothetical protein
MGLAVVISGKIRLSDSCTGRNHCHIVQSSIYRFWLIFGEAGSEAPPHAKEICKHGEEIFLRHANLQGFQFIRAASVLMHSRA